MVVESKLFTINNHSSTSVENEGSTRECANLQRSEQFSNKSNPGETDDPFLEAIGEVEKPWVVDMLLNKTPMEFHIDTGSEVTIISDSTFQKLHNTVLLPSVNIGPSQEALSARGQFRGKIRINDREVVEDIYVVENVCPPRPQNRLELRWT